MGLCFEVWEISLQEQGLLSKEVQESMAELVTKMEPDKSSSLTHVVVFVLWSMKKGRPLGAILISQPGGRKLCVTLCCGLGEL